MLNTCHTSRLYRLRRSAQCCGSSARVVPRGVQHVVCAAAGVQQEGSKPKAVVVGGGFAGLAAAKALVQAGSEVVVLDGAPSVGGLSAAIRTPAGRVVEPGIKGFWYQYSNIRRLVKEELGLSLNDVFTEYTESSFYTSKGLQVKAPILQNQPRLPAPLGNFFYTAPLFTSLPVADRLTALPLIRALLEYTADQQTYDAYDKMSALELFRSAGMSRRLYEDFLEPMLLVTLFAPGEELSAAAALDALYYFVLAQQPNFDVQWCRGPVGERVLGPLVAQLEEQGALLLPNRRVVEVAAREGDGLPGSVVARGKDGSFEVWEADTIVFAVGIRAIQGIVRSSPLLASCPTFAAINNLSSIDVMAVRLWLDKRLKFNTPSNVLANVDRSVGVTAFDLTHLQDQYKDEPGSVVELDFYHSAQLMPLSDGAVVQRCLDKYLSVIDEGASTARVLDSCVMRFPGAVSAFSPGSAANMPDIITHFPNTFFAGDWVKQGPGTHGAKGLCQEKAYVTGLQAGNLAAEAMGLRASALVLPAEEDEQHIAAGRRMAQQALAAARMLPRLPGLPHSLGTLARSL